MTSLAQRSRAPELMELESGHQDEVDRALHELEGINRLTLAYRPTLQWLGRVLARANDPVSILDVGCGHGDMLRRIAAWSARRGRMVELIGIDMSPEAIASARVATPTTIPIRYEVRDALAERVPQADIIISSLVAHHLFDENLTRFLAWMDATARVGWFVNDLHRHWLPYHFMRWAVRLAGCGRYVVHDAPVSIARGFTRTEWQALVQEADLDPATVEIRWCLPFRYGVGRIR